MKFLLTQVNQVLGGRKGSIYYELHFAITEDARSEFHFCGDGLKIRCLDESERAKYKIGETYELQLKPFDPMPQPGSATES